MEASLHPPMAMTREVRRDVATLIVTPGDVQGQPPLLPIRSAVDDSDR